jgi:hypothetical protein
MEDVVNAACLLQILQGVGLRAYLLYGWVESIEPMVDLLA